MELILTWNNGRRELILRAKDRGEENLISEIGRDSDTVDGTILKDGYTGGLCIILNKTEPQKGDN